MCIVVLAFVLRLVALDGPALRGDEAFSVMAWAGPLDRVFREMSATEPHPPLTYVAFSGWATFCGSTELAMRYLSVLSGMLAVAAVYGIGRQLGERRLGLVAALLWAANPFQIWHAQDARNYALWAGLSAVALWLMLRATGATKSSRGRAVWALYVAVEVAALYTFYLEVLSLVVHNLYVFLARRSMRGVARRWIAAQSAIGASLLILLLYFRSFLRESSYQGTAQSFNPAKLFTWFVPTLSVGDTLPGAVLDALWPALLVLLGAGAWFLWRRDRGAGWLVISLGVAPLVLLSLFSLRMEVFRPRYVIASAPAYIVALAGLVIGLGKPGRRGRWLGYGVLAGLLLLDGAALAHHYADPAFGKSPDWRGLVAVLEARARPGDLVVQNEPDPAFGYYYTGAHTTIPARADADATETAAQFEAALSEHGALWFLPTVNPSWDTDQAALHWLEANAQQIDDGWVGDFRVQQWRAWEVTAEEVNALPAHTDIRVGDFACMVGYEVYPPLDSDGTLRVGGGERLRLALYWAPTAAAPRDYTVFVHLIGPANSATGTPLWAQHDHPPQDGHAPTSMWQPGGIVRDVFFVDLAGVPAGDYTVRFGLYDPATETRLEVANEQAPGLVQDNAAILFDVTVLPD